MRKEAGRGGRKNKEVQMDGKGWRGRKEGRESERGRESKRESAYANEINKRQNACMIECRSDWQEGVLEVDVR